MIIDIITLNRDSRVTGLVPSTTMSASLTYYSTADAKTSLTDTVKDNLPIILGAVAAVLLIILLLVLRILRVERRVNRNKRVTVPENDIVKKTGE